MKVRGLRAKLGRTRNPHPVGVDLNVMFRAAAQRLSEQAAERRRIEQSGVSSHSYDEHDNLAVLQESAPAHPLDPLRAPRTLWRTLGSLPFNLPGDLVVAAGPTEAAKNGCTLRDLLERRLHRAYRNALVRYNAMDLQTANARARRALVYIAEPVVKVS